MKTLYVTDLDGTLLNRESRVSYSSASIISRLSRQGALITVATARTPATVEPLLRSTFTTPEAIVMTGAARWNRQNHHFVNPHFISQSSTQTIVDEFSQSGLHPMVYSISPDSKLIHVHIAGSPTAKEQKFLDERSHLPLKRIHILPQGANTALPAQGRAILIIGIGAIEAINSLSARFTDSGLCSVSSYPDIFNPQIGYIELFAPNVSKASALQQLKTDMQANRLIVFGDNLNDLPMMDVADVAVAVENALPQVKEKADLVIGTNQSDAVANFILSDFEKNSYFSQK